MYDLATSPFYINHHHLLQTFTCIHEMHCYRATRTVFLAPCSNPGEKSQRGKGSLSVGSARHTETRDGRSGRESSTREGEKAKRTRVFQIILQRANSKIHGQLQTSIETVMRSVLDGTPSSAKSKARSKHFSTWS